MRILQKCKTCAAQYEVSEKALGSQFECLCGALIPVLPRLPKVKELLVANCASCGAQANPQQPGCESCGSSFKNYNKERNTLCPSCLNQISDKSLFCPHCAERIDPKAFYKKDSVNDLWCPSCKEQGAFIGKELAQSAYALECAKCFGIFLSPKEVDLLIEKSKLLPVRQEDVKNQPAGKKNPFSYRKCMYCLEIMTPKNFMKFSGVIVDVCSTHGYWFDHLEIDKIVGWVRKGGMADAKARELEELKFESFKQDLNKKVEAMKSLNSRDTRSPASSFKAVSEIISTLFKSF